jgi:predicted RNase H-like HicB family nuclease
MFQIGALKRVPFPFLIILFLSGLCYYVHMIKKTKNNRRAFMIEFEREEDKRWIAEIPKLPGVMAYGVTKTEAKQKVYAMALRTLADKIEQGRTLIPVTQLFKYEMARG